GWGRATHGLILFLVPSIALLSQTLREWTAEATVPLHCVAVCSDSKVNKRSKQAEENEDLHTYDLPIPVTTDAAEICQKVQTYLNADSSDNTVGARSSRPSHPSRPLTVIFSTYQSLEAVATAQQQGLPEFDLIICDEAHRTTGVTAQGSADSHFVLVHDAQAVKGKKRLYMTATPRLYKESAKTKARENEAEVFSMDDPDTYGPELHRLGFAEAVSRDLLTDYKVMVLAVDEKYVSRTFQRQLADEDNALTLEDAVKITGCWNGLAKRMARAIDTEGFEGDTTPMRRAVAFCGRIDHSKTIRDLFNEMVREYCESHPTQRVLRCEVDHVDGTQNVLERNRKLDWLKADTTPLDTDQGTVCRILSNARCLSEGVDVPALDAVMFLSPRNSIVDVVQSVGRVMRKAPGKKYGYIILPIGIPADMTPEEALKDNKKYEVVWQVLQALRAHDDRFNAVVNQIELNERKPPQIEVIGVGSEPGEDSLGEDHKPDTAPKTTQLELNFPELEEWRDAIFAKIVQKCGDRRYWETWAKDVATIAESHISRIEALLMDSEHREVFEAFVAGLRQNINPNVSEADAIEMLSQHLITKPVFDALFEQYPFTELNPVSQAMQQMLDLLEGQSLSKDTQKLDRFYASVEKRAAGIDNAAGKQKIILELYDKFFKTAFPRVSDRLGIVYTPVEVVDFILHSADYALRQEFGRGLTDAGVHILDPFTGTGTFLVRLLQSGLIQPADLPRKFREELHANEIVLLAYYIAAINIEETYHATLAPSAQRQGEQDGKQNDNLEAPRPQGEGFGVRATYEPFQGIVLTDTFQMFENTEGFLSTIFPENNQRVERQKQNPIQVIIGNPPYSAGQTSENDGNKNLKYPQLDDRIRQTYAEYSSATLKNSLYASEILALRWASDRIQERGIVTFVTNGSFIDGNAADGLRKCFYDEFTSIYCFNLRGLRGQKTSGERAKQEGGQIFGQGSSNTIAIILLVKNPDKAGNCKLFYHDIGDYLNRQQKLDILIDLGSIASIPWQEIKPNDSHDWINQRDPAFDAFISLGDKQDPTATTIFDLYSSGVKTNRDTWCYNFSANAVANNMSRTIDFYNSEVERYRNIQGQKPNVEKFVNTDSTKISWTRFIKRQLELGKTYSYDQSGLVNSMYRPFCKQRLYFSRVFNEVPGQMPRAFPIAPVENLAICVTGLGVQPSFNALIVNVLPNLCLQGAGVPNQCFPLYTYEKQSELGSLFATVPSASGYTRKDNIPDSILQKFQSHYQTPQITKEDLFYYIYGILHSPEYKTRFAADLKKMLPRIPFAADFTAFSTAGRNLAHWHLNYETIEPFPLEEVHTQLLLDDRTYHVQKMKFAKKPENGRSVPDKTSIIYNNKITLTGIPLEAYDYKVCDRSAIEWIMERYQVSRDKASGILNDPNTYNPENPRYILDLLKRIVRVSVETLKIVNELPPLEES
ncbi:MAG: DEAD/DEAH box helicase, partial [Prochlorotrichaceae cyanobacterium]